VTDLREDGALVDVERPDKGQIKVPITVVQRLAKHLQYRSDPIYGNMLSADQMRRAERILREFVETARRVE
jgi:hypothetical protein